VDGNDGEGVCGGEGRRGGGGGGDRLDAGGDAGGNGGEGDRGGGEEPGREGAGKASSGVGRPLDSGRQLDTTQPISGKGGSAEREKGGDRGWRGNLVKCLHAQLGDRLVRGEQANPVGGVVLRRLEELGVPVAGTDECWRECAPPSTVYRA
jgi:hypothetical protein